MSTLNLNDKTMQKTMLNWAENTWNPVTVKFLSCEPLIGDLGELNLRGIDWVIAGGASGSRASPMKEEWVMNIKNQADAQGVSFFFKQWGTWGSDGVKRSGKLLKGGDLSRDAEEIRYGLHFMEKPVARIR